jgi:hypothetical protein
MTDPNTIVNLSTGYQDGISADEVGINISKFEVTVEPEYRNKLPGKYGAARALIIGPMMLLISVAGEVLGATGLMAVVIGTGATIANSVAFFGAPTTGKYLTKAVIAAEREQGKLMTVELEFDSYAGIT